MSRIYTTKTPSLKATIADVRNLDAKKINLKGKDILEHIKENVPTIKHASDTRETVTENDLWGQYIETLEDGTVIVHDDWVTNTNADSSALDSSITKVENNKAYVGEDLFANIQSEKIKDGTDMFYRCTNLTTFASDLSSLTYAYRMFCFCSNLENFTSDLSSLTYGANMFTGCSNLTSFTSNLSSLKIGSWMFRGCSNLTKFTSILSSLINGENMFYDCSNFTTFTSDLSSLTKGYYMFCGCKNLTSFTPDLSSLTDGKYMFQKCTNLTTFTSDLSSLITCWDMFNGCTNLTTFASDLNSLTDGWGMFNNCTNLTTFTGDLGSLIDGGKMFYKTKLTPQSVMFIVISINDIVTEKKLYTDGVIPYVTKDNETNRYSAPKGFMSDGAYVYTYNATNTNLLKESEVGKITIGINVSNNADTIQQQLKDFANEATFDSWEDLKQTFVDKGWTVTWQYGGTTDTIPDTYGLRGGERIIPCPIFAKLVEVEDKDHAEYCNEEGTKFYNIEWGHDVTNPQDFQQFDSLEDAMRAFNIFPKENIIVTEE